jgi:hypothetical protein
MVLKDWLTSELTVWDITTKDGVKLRSIYQGDLSLNKEFKVIEGDIWRVGMHIYTVLDSKLHKLTADTSSGEVADE